MSCSVSFEREDMLFAFFSLFASDVEHALSFEVRAKVALLSLIIIVP